MSARSKKFSKRAKRVAAVVATAVVKKYGVGAPITALGKGVVVVSKTMANAKAASVVAKGGQALIKAGPAVSSFVGETVKTAATKGAKAVQPVASKVFGSIPGSKYVAQLPRFGAKIAGVALPVMATGVVSDLYYMGKDTAKYILTKDQKARQNLEQYAPKFGSKSYAKELLGSLSGRYTRKTRISPKIREKVEGLVKP